MSLVVNNNPAAFGVWTNFNANSVSMKKAMEHLSTGVKSVSDNPAGVGISERMRSQYRNVSSARSNVENGLSMLQTADSWMQKIGDMLARMGELAIEAGDGTKTNGDKTNLQAEFSQLQSEITRITSKDVAAAKFNGLYLFRGGNGQTSDGGLTVASGNIGVQIGADVGQAINLTLADLQVGATTAIGTVLVYSYAANHSVAGTIANDAVTWGSVIDNNNLSVTSSFAVGKIAKAIDYLSQVRASNGAQQNRLENTRSGLMSYEDNLRASESKLRDIDMARESTNLAKYQILSQVSNAMLAQANQLPASVVQLIG